MVYRQTAGQLSTRVIQPRGSERSQNRSSSCSPGSGENVQNGLNMEDDKTFEVDPGGRAAGVQFYRQTAMQLSIKWRVSSPAQTQVVYMVSAQVEQF